MSSLPLGGKIQLLMGPAFLPATPELVNAVTRITVTNDARSRDGFQITFNLSKIPLFDYSLVVDPRLQPMQRIIVVGYLGLLPEVLIDGLITNHQVQPSRDPGKSTLTVSGSDVSIAMDLKENRTPYPNHPDMAIFAEIIGQYAQYGLIPMPSPTPVVPIELQRTPQQHDTDYRYINQLAGRNGFVFFVEPLTIGINKAYFGPEPRAGIPQKALTLGMGADDNLESLSFQNDALAPSMIEAQILEANSKSTIPFPPVPQLRIPPLALIPAIPYKSRVLDLMANQDPAQAASTLTAAITSGTDAVTGSGTLDTSRYGSVLRARKPVGVRGMGFTYNGLYFVNRVTHSIEKGRWTQQFELSREGYGSLLPVLPV